MGIELLAADGDSALHARISRDIRELDELIEELLLASRLSAGESLESREEVELLALSAEEGARVGAQVSGIPTTMEGDPRTLRRMLRNLFENARRHGKATPIDAHVETNDAGMVRIVVSDTGPGVPEAERERIFTPFYRATRVAEDGSGLGLALVRQIARRHGGDARYLPREGGGSCFEITLAKVQPPLEGPRDRSPAPEGGCSMTCRGRPGSGTH
jgi:two-component system OmpR family sensor kinase